MLAEFSSRVTTHEEWTLRLPADASDVAQAISVATTSRANAAVTGGILRLTDVRVSLRDENTLAIGYSYEEVER